MANQHTKLPYNTTSGAVPSAYSAENDYGIKAGELAVNLYQGQEFLVTRNENGDIVKFSSDNHDVFVKGNGTGSIKQKGSACIANGDYSFAMGYQSSATTFYAHAEGSTTLASGGFSHAEGSRTTADGTISHAEGDSTTASGSTSHAEGYYTLASGSYSHAEGNSTTASGSCSHAEGRQTSALTEAAHAEGVKSLAAGVGSHAEGNYAIANNSNEHASGIYNKSHTSGTSEWDDLQGATTSTDTVEPFTGTSTLFSVGFGNTGLRRNALEVTRQGQTLLNSRKTYFRYGDTSANMGDQSYAATGATQYQTTPGVAEYITMFDVIEKVRGNDNYAVFEKGSGANSIQQKGTNCVASGANSVAIGSGTTARFSDEFVCGYYNKYPSGHLQGSTLFSIGNGLNDTNRRNAVIVKKPDQISPTLPANHVEVFVSGDLHSGKFVRNRTITASTGNSSLSALTSEIGSSDSIIFINNSNYSGGTSDSIFISSGSTMLRGQTVMLYFTKPMKIGEIKTETEQAFPEIISKVNIYYHIDGSVSTTDGSSAAAFLSLHTFTVVEITKIGNRDTLDDSGMDSYVIEFRNVKDA